MKLQFIILLASFINFCYSNYKEIRLLQTKEGLYTLNKEGSIYVKGIELKCTIQIIYLEDNWEVYKTIHEYPVDVYRIDKSQATTTYWTLNKAQHSIDWTACKGL